MKSNRAKVLTYLSLLFITHIFGTALAQIPAGTNESNGELVVKAPLLYDISHYNINIDSINFSAFTIKANTKARIVAKQAIVSQVTFDLLKFTVDSILSGGSICAYTYNDTLLTVTLPTPLPANDSIDVEVFYNGSPSVDGSGWGGFYFSGSFAFNLGVGFAANPHNYGRAWYPCSDTFDSKSRYDFFITTSSSAKAFCNGFLVQQIANPNGTITWHWKMNDPIPSYLVSMAVGPYHTVTNTLSGIPVEIACLASDTNNVNATFSNLDTTLTKFIDSYGPYPFDKVGYCLVPFNSGAMEHAASIHIGRVFVNGSQSYATLWAHELSHMWWGDKVTCKTAEDMWLNEGFASFNEALYTQNISGDVAYTNWIRSNHRKVLQFAHTPAGDGSYLTLNNIPHDYTYGQHVYNKGASIAHSLRGMLGDSAFFAGCKIYMDNHAYGNADSYDLKNDFNSMPTVDVTRFFDDWVFTPGFPHFSVDSVAIYIGAFDHVYVHTRQRNVGNSNHLYKMPVEINLTDGNNDTTFTVLIDSVTNVFHFPLLFTPTMVTIDRDLKITDAVVDYEKNINSTGNNIMYETNVSLNVQDPGINGSTIRVEHNYVEPDGFKQSNPGIRLSDYHYWTVKGLLSSGFESSANFTYDGSNSSVSGFLDNTLITGVEDSIVMMYREGSWDDWSPVNGFTLNKGANSMDKRGSVIVDSLKAGEYCLGYFDHLVGLSAELELKKIKIFPNPANEKLTVEINSENKSDLNIQITDTRGSVILYQRISKNSREFIWDSSDVQSGMYHVILVNNQEAIGYAKVIIQK